jgi:N-methylhydantoinase B
VKLQRRGVIDQDVLNLVMSNVRVPEERLGDLKAQLGALKVGARRLTELLDRYGADTVETAINELKARSEQLMRAHIETVPDGTYEAIVHSDSDGVVFEKLAIRLRMTVSGSNLSFSFAGSSPPCKGPMNCPADLATAAIYVAIKHVFPDVPINAGCFVPIHVERPVGTFLDAQYPRPCAGAAAEVCQRVMESVFGAMGKAMPERMFAAPFGTSGNFSLGGYDPAEDRRYIMYMFSGGGYGAWADGDGLTNGCSTLSIAKTQPVEVLEQHYPVLYEEYALRENSASDLAIASSCFAAMPRRRSSWIMASPVLPDYSAVSRVECFRSNFRSQASLSCRRMCRKAKAMSWSRVTGFRCGRRVAADTGRLPSDPKRRSRTM